jgi:peptidyl-prolyl cis-trans isomerase B (cyclophilin B)
VKSRFRGSRALLAATASILLMTVGGCTSQTPTSATQTETSASSAASATSTATTSAPAGEGANLYTPAYKPNGNEVAVIKTDRGTIKVKLYGTDAPINVGNFIELAQKGYFNGVKFHRLEPGFVVQAGDPQTRDLTTQQVKELVANQNKGIYKQGEPMLGTGGPGYTIAGEFDPAKILHPHVDGTLAMARLDDPNSAGSQFYFTLAPESFLDGKYTVIGDTVSGLAAVHKLVVGDEIKSVTIENATK